VVVIITAFGYSVSLPKSIQKKVDKELDNLWPEKSIVLRIEELAPLIKTESEKLGISSIYKLTEDNNTKGYMVYVMVPSKFDYFDLGIFYDLELKIKSIKVLVYREDHGGEVGSKRWLKQFIGMSVNNPIELEDDIQGIAGATISCEAATKGTREVTTFMNSHFK
jgi:Na+-translocating ferredoxin:NAD+ oxidoreductase RnfG subunit